MWRPYSDKWSSYVLAALGTCFGVCGSPVLADHYGHKQNYDVVQGYIMQCQPQSQACVPVQTNTPTAALASGQNQTTSLSVSPPASQPATQTVTLAHRQRTFQHHEHAGRRLARREHALTAVVLPTLTEPGDARDLRLGQPWEGLIAAPQNADGER